MPPSCLYLRLPNGAQGYTLEAVVEMDSVPRLTRVEKRLAGVTLRPLVLCADDFALSTGVSRAIAALLEHARLSAASCMTVSPLWPGHARWLMPFAGRADIGLHLTLTALKPLSRPQRLAPAGRFPRLGHLTRRAFLGQLDLQEIRRELEHQLDAFEQAWGAPPDFVDGHQHVHVLPGVLDVVMQLIAARAPGAYVRQCWDPLEWILLRGVAVPRALAIATLSLPLKHRLIGRRTNDSFRGVSTFGNHTAYRRQFRRYLLGPGKRPLIMCHPGNVDALLPSLDPITYQRELEFDYFMGPAFLKDVAEVGYLLSRMT
jgi:chitin disaccharide deacetylase